MTASIHQFLPTLEPGAVGNHAVLLRELLHQHGYEGELFAEHLRMPDLDCGQPFRQYGKGHPARPGDVLIYHFAIGSDVAEFVSGRREVMVVDHHNITPPSFFKQWQPELVPGVAWGQEQFRSMAHRPELAVADSEYNRRELEGVGYRRTDVLPLLVDLDRLRADVDSTTLQKLLDRKQLGGADWLFVGRLVPNKCQHDVIRSFAVYRRLYDPAARLHLVGHTSSSSYARALEAYAAALDLTAAVEFAGGVSSGALAAYYAAADVFVCLSEHEGFCIPLLEAWSHDVPVVALDAAAVGETVADAGLLLRAKPATTVATAVHRVLADDAVRKAVVSAGRRRLQWYAPAAAAARVLAALAPVLP